MTASRTWYGAFLQPYVVVEGRKPKVTALRCPLALVPPQFNVNKKIRGGQAARAQARTGWSFHVFAALALVRDGALIYFQVIQCDAGALGHAKKRFLRDVRGHAGLIIDEQVNVP